jgi:hypothetical protein
MGTPLDTFESLFDPIILGRAKSYFNAGLVGAIERGNAPLLHTTVDGSMPYDVDIRFKGDAIASAACTCPYDRSPYCKHVGAALYAIREEQANSQPSSGDPTYTQAALTTFNRVRSHLQKLEAKSSDKKSSTNIRKKNPRAKLLTLGEARKIINAPIAHFDKRRNPSPYDNDDALQGVFEVINSAARMQDTVQAVAVVLLALERTMDFLATHDDSGGYAGSALEELFLLLEELNEEIAMSEDEDLCCEVFRSIGITSQHEVFDGWDYDVRFLETCLPLTICTPARALFEEVLESRIQTCQEESSSHSSVDRFIRLRYSAMKLNGDLGTEKFARGHVADPYFLGIVARKAFLADDYKKVRKLIERQVDASNDGRRSFYSYELCSETFPHGWWTYLEAVCEIEEDTGGLLDLYQTYVISAGDTEYIEKIKRTSLEDWLIRRDAIVKALRAAKHPQDSFEALMRKESLRDEALDYCKRFPSRTPGLCQVFAEKYPCEAKSLLLGLIKDKSQATTGRYEYQRICSIIQRYQSTFGTKEALSIVNGLLEKYPQRRAMKEELLLLRSSWM